MTPIPSDQRPREHPQRKYRFWFNLVALIVGATLLVVGGMNSDTVTQSAGGVIMATVVAAIGWQARTPPES